MSSIRIYQIDECHTVDLTRIVSMKFIRYSKDNGMNKEGDGWIIISLETGILEVPCTAEELKPKYDALVKAWEDYAISRAKTKSKIRHCK